MASIEHGQHSTSFVGREAVEVFRLITLASALRLYAKTGMRANARLTPTRMLTLAREATGLHFRRGAYAAAAEAVDDMAARLRAAVPEITR